MPTYIYVCEDCSAKLEKLQSHAQMLRDQHRLRCQWCEGRLKRHFGVPAVRTESTFTQGIQDVFGPNDRWRRQAMAKARAAGISTAGKRFYPQLCRRGVLNDPQAWISDDNARGDITRRCEAMNMGAEGDINVKQREPERDPTEGPYRVADHIAQERADEVIEQEHGGKVSKQKRAQMVGDMADRLSGNG